MTTPIQASALAGAGQAGASAPQIRAGYGVGLNDVAAFERAIAQAKSGGGSLTVDAAPQPTPSEAMQALFRPFEHLNFEADNIAETARVSVDNERELTPSEMLKLNVQCAEFMFHCSLTSNIANRTSDGLQQLFRQQA